MKLSIKQKINALLLAIFIFVAIGSYSCSKDKKVALGDKYEDPFAGGDSTVLMTTPEP
jgi:hypothetical protein